MTVVNNVVDGQARLVVVDIEPASQLSVAMVENSMPLVARISLTNTSDAALSNLTVEFALLPDFSGKWTAHVSAIPADLAPAPVRSLRPADSRPTSRPAAGPADRACGQPARPAAEIPRNTRDLSSKIAVMVLGGGFSQFLLPGSGI